MAKRLPPAMFERAMQTLDGVAPWRGMAPSGRPRNYLGAVAPKESAGDEDQAVEPIELVEVARPPSSEGLFEFYSLLNAVQEARGRFVAVSLGAHYGGPLVNAALALKRINPMPYRLVGVEGDRHMVAMLRRHFRDHGIDPSDHCIINAVVSDTNTPVIFPTSATRTGANTAFHLPEHRESVYRAIAEAGFSKAVLKNILATGSTGLALPLWKDIDAQGELEMVSAITLADILGATGAVDYLEIDIQAVERYVLPPAGAVINRNVRWIHLGTHGRDIHYEMRTLFDSWGWRVLADLLPETTYIAPDREFQTYDGVLVARNPAFSSANSSGGAHRVAA